MLLQSETEIKNWLISMDIIKYTIREEDDSFFVDVHGHVILTNRKLIEIPVQFGAIYGDFRCNNNSLKSLEGCPREVNGYFDCENNQLTSLLYSPIVVENGFNCARNHLITLQGSPDVCEGEFNCSRNKLTSLQDCPAIINGHFSCRYNLLTNLEHCPRFIEETIDCSYNNLSQMQQFKCDLYGAFIHQVEDVNERITALINFYDDYLNLEIEPNLLNKVLDTTLFKEKLNANLTHHHHENKLKL